MTTNLESVVIKDLLGNFILEEIMPVCTSWDNRTTCHLSVIYSRFVIETFVPRKKTVNRERFFNSFAHDNLPNEQRINIEGR